MKNIKIVLYLLAIPKLSTHTEPFWYLIAKQERIGNFVRSLKKIRKWHQANNWLIRDMDITLTDNLKNNETSMGSVPVPIRASSIRLVQSSFDYSLLFGNLKKERSREKSKWYVSLNVSALLNDSSVLIEGVLFRARYLGSTQLVCEGEPTKSTRMCQAEEAVSRIKVRLSFSYYMFAFYAYALYLTTYFFRFLPSKLYFYFFDIIGSGNYSTLN